MFLALFEFCRMACGEGIMSSDKKPEWGAIRTEYIGGGTRYRKLAEKYSVSLKTLSDRASREGWVEERNKVRDKGALKAIQKRADAIANNATKIERARSLAIERLISALESMPQKGGSHSRQVITDGGKRIIVDYDLPAIVSALEKLSEGITFNSDYEPVKVVFDV